MLDQITGPADVLCFAEGYATAATVYEAVGYPTVATFDAGNMVVVGKALHKKYPQILKVFAGDDDKEKEKNIGRQKAERAAEECDGLTIFPIFL